MSTILIKRERDWDKLTSSRRTKQFKNIRLQHSQLFKYVLSNILDLKIVYLKEFFSLHMQYSGLESAKIPRGSCWQNEHFIRERILKSVNSELRSDYKMRRTENDNVDYLRYMVKTFKWKSEVNSLKEKKKELKTFSNYNFAFFPLF